MTKPWLGATVLVVDDSVRVRDSLKVILQNLGLTVVGEADNGQEALEFLKKQTVDLVSLDIIMPQMHGIECFREIKKISPNQRCFFLTILAKEKPFLDAYKNEISEFLFMEKPFNTERVEQMLKYLYGLSKTSKIEDSALMEEIEAPTINQQQRASII